MDVNEQLREAAKRGRLPDLLAALRRGANVEGSEWAGVTALHCASDGGHRECVRALLDRGASAGRGSVSGWTALHRSAAHGHAGVVRELLRHGVDLDSCDRFGSTPLDCAVTSGFAEVVDLLLAGGADPARCVVVSEYGIRAAPSEREAAARLVVPADDYRVAAAAARLAVWMGGAHPLQDRAHAAVLDAARFDEAALAGLVLAYTLPGHQQHARARINSDKAAARAPERAAAEDDDVEGARPVEGRARRRRQRRGRRHGRRGGRAGAGR